MGQAQMTRERAQELADEVAGTAGRLRDALDELRPVAREDVKGLGARLDALERRVAELESRRGRRAAPAGKR